MGNLTTPISVQKLQTALHAKAKAEAGYRFYTLYDKIFREDILAYAWAQCRSNDGAPGVDAAGLHGGRSVRGAAVARRTGAGAQRGELPTGPHQTSVYPEGQFDGEESQAQAAGYLDPTGSGVHDSSNAGARTDLRSRSAFRAVRLPAGPQCPAGGGGSERPAIPWPHGRGRRRLGGLLWQYSTLRTDAVARATHRRSACAASDQDVAGVRC